MEKRKCKFPEVVDKNTLMQKPPRYITRKDSKNSFNSIEVNMSGKSSATKKLGNYEGDLWDQHTTPGSIDDLSLQESSEGGFGSAQDRELSDAMSDIASATEQVPRLQL
jgi:hypothetical protein